MTGWRSEAAMYRISHISARPLALVAFMTRPPAAAAATQAVMAECSLSTATKFVLTCPSATNLANVWTTSVDGVMGYAATTSGLICRMASATAMLPSSGITLPMESPP